MRSPISDQELRGVMGSAVEVSPALTGGAGSVFEAIEIAERLAGESACPT
jgi:hypothetical protein